MCVYVLRFTLCICMVGFLCLGMLEKINSPVRGSVELIAMCFPTPRDPITDRAKGLFEGHINLYPSNRYVWDRNDVVYIRITLSPLLPAHSLISQPL